MGVQQVSINTAFAFQPGAAGNGNIDLQGEDFAELVRQDEVTAALNTRDRQRMIERERIAEVGFVQFQREQYEIRKMLRLMTEFAEEASTDMQRKFDGIVADLEQYPPHYPQEMYARIEAAIACIPDGAPNNLKQRMKEAYASLKKEMAKPDPELERLKRAEEQKRRQAFFRPDALATAAFL